MTRLEAIRSRLKNATPKWDADKVLSGFVSPDMALCAHAPADLALLLACVDEMRGALKEISSVSTYYDNTLHMCVTATETLTSIEEKLR